jgi:two-component system, OmpR family, sensor histidine kinase CiaH
MNILKRKKLLVATIVYWFLLLYITAQLVWWFIALQQQSRQMSDYKLRQLRLDDPYYIAKRDHILFDEHRKTAQYIEEGTTFLLLFLTGAIFVYLPVRRQVNLQQQQQNFMMAVTHELKTPISVIKLNLETLQKYQLDEQKQQKIIQAALQETNRLNRLTNNILVSAQLEGSGYRLSKESLDFSELTRKTAEDFLVRYPERTWDMVIQPGLILSGDELLLQMMENNLLENAIRYSSKESLISVSLQKEGLHLVLTIKDLGIGIPDKEKKKIFQKFYRIGNEATRTTQGSGLGLWLCKKIASDHKAQIRVSDNSPVGTIFAIVFGGKNLT